MKAVYFFCEDLDRDPVAMHVFEACRDMYPLLPAGPKLDGLPSWQWDDGRGNSLHFALTRDTLSHEFDRLADELNAFFPPGDFAFGGVVNWHAGANAPDPVFSYHGVGHSAAAVFAPSDARFLRNIAAALQRGVDREGLEGWRVLEEATHFSGMPHGCDPSRLGDWNVPQADLEIGSLAESWRDERAARVLAEALGRVFDPEGMDGSAYAPALFVGGIHFEPAFAVSPKFCFAQTLTYPWLIEGMSNDDSAVDELGRRIAAAAASVRPGIQAIVFHDKAKANVKNAARNVATDMGVECMNHKSLRALRSE